MARYLTFCIFLWGIWAHLHGQNTSMNPVASVFLKNQDTLGIDWQVVDSSRYWYYADGQSDLTENYCYDSTAHKYYLCRKIDYYLAPDTSIMTWFEPNAGMTSLEQVYCSFTRTNSLGRTVEYGGCYDPNGNNSGYYRNYIDFDTMGRMKQQRYASWSNIFQNLTTSSITSFFYDTLGYEKYQYVQTNYAGSYYIAYKSWDSLDRSTNTTYSTEIKRNTPTSAWDTNQHKILWADTVGNVITSVNTVKGINFSGTFGNVIKDSTIIDTSTLTISQYRYSWNDTVNAWQLTNQYYMERDSNGRTLYRETANARYTGAPVLISNKSNYTYDSIGRPLYYNSNSYNYFTGVLSETYERETEYDVVMGDSTANITTTTNQNLEIPNTIISREVVYFDSLSRKVEVQYSIYDSFAQTWHPVDRGYYYYDESKLVDIQELVVPSINLTIAPNPTQSAAILYFDNKQAIMGTLALYNVSDVQVSLQSINLTQGKQEIPLNLQPLGVPAGLYFVKLSTPEGESTAKLLYQP